MRLVLNHALITMGDSMKIHSNFLAVISTAVVSATYFSNQPDFVQQSWNPIYYSIPNEPIATVPVYAHTAFPMMTSPGSYDSLESHLQTVYIPSHSMGTYEPGVPQYVQSQTFSPSSSETIQTTEDEDVDAQSDTEFLPQASSRCSPMVKLCSVGYGVAVVIGLIIFLAIFFGRQNHH